MADKTKKLSTTTKAPSAYAEAGVNIALGDKLKGGLKEKLKHATRPEVMGAIGGFGGLFDLSKTKYKEPVLVSSVDGVGTKLKLAFETGRHEIVGHDIVNHCINDIAVMGAEPLFFLDYIGLGKLEPNIFHKLIGGMGAACRAANTALIGGETAQMPGFYQPGEYDLVGCIIGIAEKSRLMSGTTIKPGDQIIGLSSNGLHTNGYSLARKILFEQLGHKINDRIPGENQTFADALLRPHVNYSPLMLSLAKKFNRASSKQRAGNSIFGFCHITGGGFSGNLPRILPKTTNATIRSSSWPTLPIFAYLAEKSGVSFDELYEVFNMGIGMCIVVSPEATKKVIAACKKAGTSAYHIGEITKGRGQVKLD
ncbi:MAG TPA: phosphoribosylformylglycinamidine cyclo-ligase [Opitutaceae bacterium]|nr:phosphoribosylformylglycinamidine cyclo-ligase [Opitutaceae bacterium]